MSSVLLCVGARHCNVYARLSVNAQMQLSEKHQEAGQRVKHRSFIEEVRMRSVEILS